MAQFNLNRRLVFGIGVPFKDRALPAAAGEAKSTKQYPALLLLPTLGSSLLMAEFITMYSPRELVADHFHVDLFTHLEPKVADKVLVNPRLELAHPT